jgi:ABC-2 type transport system permease protein
VIRTVATLLWHDLAVGFKNKTLVLVLCIPLFVYVTLTLVESSNADNAPANIALLDADAYAPVLTQSLERVPDLFAVRWVSSEAEATRLLKDREVDGVLTNKSDNPTGLVLKVVQLGSSATLNIVQRLSALQAAVDGARPSWVASVQPLRTGSMKRQTLPVWILMMVLLVGFIVLPAHVAEEKEKQLLLGWLQTPVREGDWLASKLAYGLVLTLVAVVALLVTATEPFHGHWTSFLSMLVAGGFCFSAFGICLGLLCRTPASARTLGVLCYLPLLVPAALSDMSPQLRSITPWIPSSQLYEPLRAMLLDDSGAGMDPRAWISLVGFGLLACVASLRLVKVRWLM